MPYNDDKTTSSSTQPTNPTSSSPSVSRNTGLTLRSYNNYHSEDNYEYAELDGSGYLHTPTESQIGGPAYEDLDALPPPPRYEDVVSDNSSANVSVSRRDNVVEKGYGRGFEGNDGGNNRGVTTPRRSNHEAAYHQDQVQQSTSASAAAEEMGRLLSAALQFVRKDNEQGGGEQDESYHSTSDAPTQSKEKKLGRCVAIPQHITLPSSSLSTKNQQNSARQAEEEKNSGTTLQFCRAYSKALQPHSIDKPTFLEFVDGLNELLSHPSLSLSAFSSHTSSSSSTTSPTQSAAIISTPLISSYLEISNEVFFASRGLKVDVKTLPALLDTLLDQASPSSSGVGKKEVREIKKIGRDVEDARTGEEKVRALFPLVRAVEWEEEQGHGIVHGSAGKERVRGVGYTSRPAVTDGDEKTMGLAPHATSEEEEESDIDSFTASDNDNEYHNSDDATALEADPALRPEKRKMLMDLEDKKRALRAAYREETQVLRNQGVVKKDRQWKDVRVRFREEKKRLRAEKGEVRKEGKKEKRAVKGEKKKKKKEKEGGKGKGKEKVVDRKRDGSAEGGGYWIVVQSLDGGIGEDDEEQGKKRRKKKKSTEEIIWMVVQHSLGLGFF